MLFSGLAYCSTMKMEVVRSSDTSVNFYKNTRRYIPEYSALHSHFSENLKPKAVNHFYCLGPMACSGSIFHRILVLPGVLLFIVWYFDGSFGRRRLYIIWRCSSHYFLYCIICVRTGLASTYSCIFSFLIWPSYVHLFTACRNVISADCITLSSSRLNIQNSLPYNWEENAIILQNFNWIVVLICLLTQI
jgi:hypothetical protein